MYRVRVRVRVWVRGCLSNFSAGGYNYMKPAGYKNALPKKCCGCPLLHCCRSRYDILLLFMLHITKGAIIRTMGKSIALCTNVLVGLLTSIRMTYAGVCESASYYITRAACYVTSTANQWLTDVSYHRYVVCCCYRPVCCRRVVCCNYLSS